MRFWRIRIIPVVLVFVLAAGELIARFGLGLGTPPLSVPHPRIEYIFLPNQDVKRFENRVFINAYGMRSLDFQAKKAAGEFRVMAFGDSVLNGGNLTDHAKLATTLLVERLAATKGAPVVIGNISAGSWGPGNWLAYAREYGFFDADVVLLLISSHDIGDNPTFAPLDPNTHPQQQPVSALLEGLTRYLPRYLPAWASTNPVDPMSPGLAAKDESGIAQGSSDLRTFLEFARAQVPRVLVAQFPETTELGPEGSQQGYGLIKQIAEESGAEVFSVFPAMKSALDQGENPYRDNIHVNDLGQAILARVFFDALVGDSKDQRSLSAVGQ